MIILTGSKGFIGKKFLSALKKKGKEVVEVEKNDSWHWRQNFYRWKEVNASFTKVQCPQLQTQT